MAYDTTHMGCAADATVQHAAVVDAGCAVCRGHDGAGMAFGIAAADAGTAHYHVADGGSVGVGHKRCGGAADGLQLSVDGALERRRRGTYRGVDGKAVREHVVATHTLDVVRTLD